MTVICSFDIGIKNLAFCVAKVVNSKQINIIKWTVINISDNNKLSNLTYTKLFDLCADHLDRYESLFNLCDEIIFEKQPNVNQKMKNLSTFIYSYFILKYYRTGKITKITPIDAKNKLRVYTGPYVECTIKDKYRKNKILGIAYASYYARNNSYFSACFKDKRKKMDDFSDCFLQLLWYINRYKCKMDLDEFQIKQQITGLVRRKQIN